MKRSKILPLGEGKFLSLVSLDKKLNMDELNKKIKKKMGYEEKIKILASISLVIGVVALILKAILL